MSSNKMSSNKSPIIISVEGNIGAGKSTIMEKMQELLESKEIVFMREPVDIWEKMKDPHDGENILVKFYKDPAMYSFSFQVMAYITRVSLLINTIRENPEAKVIICERSLDADRNIFAKMLRDEGKMKNIEYQIYNQLFQEYVKNLNSEALSLSGIIYIDATPEICVSRVMKRAREGESQISLDYLKACRLYHEKWLVEGEDLVTERVLRVVTNEDATYEKGNEMDCGNKWVQHIQTFVLDTMRELC